jgi:hypothetical protein
MRRGVLGLFAIPLAALLGVAATAPAQEVFGRAEILNWRIQDAPLPTPLLTTSSGSSIGTLGDPGTQILIGGRSIGLGEQPGGRFTVGGFLEGDAVGGELSFFYLNRFSSSRAYIDRTGEFRFGLPYFNAVAELPAVQAISGPPLITPDRFVFIPQLETTVRIPGTRIPGAQALVGFNTTSQLYGYEGNGFAVVEWAGPVRVDVLAGFRYLRLNEDMLLESTSLQLPSVPGEVFTFRDTFSTTNDFYGGQVGARVVVDLGVAFAEVTGKIGAGPMTQEVDIAGALQTTGGAFPSGMYAQRTNSGNSSETRFAVVSEVQANAGAQFGPVRVFAGYSFMYVSSVARPGNQISPAINPNQSEVISASASPPGLGSGPIAPVRTVNSSSFWAQGVSVGIELRY